MSTHLWPHSAANARQCTQVCQDSSANGINHDDNNTPIPRTQDAALPLQTPDAAHVRAAVPFTRYPGEQAAVQTDDTLKPFVHAREPCAGVDSGGHSLATHVADAFHSPPTEQDR